jgi:tetratricopeptide (TPR) repeat protein
LLKGIDNRKGIVTLGDVSSPKSFSIARDWFRYLWDREGNICLILFPHKLKNELIKDIPDEQIQKFVKISDVLDKKSRGINLGILKPILNDLAKKFPEWYYPTYVLIRDVLIPEGEIHEAKEAVQNLLAKKPDNPYHRLLETLIYIEEGDYRQAVNSATVFEREIRRRKFPDLESVYMLSFLYTKASLFQRAEELINWALKISPQKKDLLILRAFYRFERGRIEEAIKDVHSAISLPPKDSFPIWNTLLLEAYSIEDNLNKCEEIAKRVGKSAPNSKINLWVELLKAEKSSNWDEALSIWDRMYEGREEEKNYSHYFVGKASILLKMGKVNEARRFLEEQPLLEVALREKQNNLGFLGMFSIYGIALYNCGEFEKAVDVLFRAYKCVEMDKGLRWFLGPYEVKTLASTEYYLGLALRKEGKEIEANKFLKKAKSWGFSLPQ